MPSSAQICHAGGRSIFSNALLWPGKEHKHTQTQTDTHTHTLTAVEPQPCLVPGVPAPAGWQITLGAGQISLAYSLMEREGGCGALLAAREVPAMGWSSARCGVWALLHRTDCVRLPGLVRHGSDGPTARSAATTSPRAQDFRLRFCFVKLVHGRREVDTCALYKSCS